MTEIADSRAIRQVVVAAITGAHDVIELHAARQRRIASLPVLQPVERA